ncbi:uncharacterized protein LOC142982322 [Anticarsia gemmatalis]|uniref:uncharacterized protein LOC142982322 n=1 Tax=Anticarsia gemmatalis TaxID=129554 RepID=UPI003F76AAA1
MQASSRHALVVDRSFLEDLLLRLGDMCEIRIQMDSDTAAITGLFAVAGGLLGVLFGGARGAMLGAGIGGAAGFGASAVVTLREIWDKIKAKLVELFYIMQEYLSSLEPGDYIRAAQYVLENGRTRAQFVIMIIQFIGKALNADVFSTVGDFLRANQRYLQ